MTLLLAISSLLFSTLTRNPVITEGTFANGIQYYIAANPVEKGFADFSVIQPGCTESGLSSRGMLDMLENTYPTDFLYPKGVGYSETGFISYPADNVRVFAFRDVPVGVKSDLDSTLLILRDIMAEHDYPQAVVICGDIDKSRVLSVLETLCLTLKPRLDGTDMPEFPGAPAPACAEDEIVIPLHLKKPSRDKMNTVVPYVGEFMLQQVRFIFEERMYRMFRDRGIPYSSEFRNRSIHVKVPQEFLERAESGLDSLRNSICTFGFGFGEMLYARKRAVPQVAALGMEPVISNAELSRRCQESYLYNADLPTSQSVVDFLEKKTELDGVDLSRLNLFASLSLRGHMDTSVFSLPLDFVPADTLLAVPGRPRMLKVKNESAEIVTGGKIITLSNGMKVIYKHTDDRLLSYCLDLRGGSSMVADITDEERPYLTTVMQTSRIGGVSGHEFFSAMRTAGIEMEFSSGWSDFCIKGSAPADKLGSVLKALWKVSYDRVPDAGDFDYALDCAALDGGRPPVEEDFPDRVETYFRERFSNWSDGVLVVTGPLPEDKVKTELCAFLGSVKVSRKYAVKVPYEGEAGNYPLSVRSYAAFRVADIAIRHNLGSTLLPFGMYIETTPSMTLSPTENIGMEIRCVPCPEDGVPADVVPADSLDVTRLMRYTLSFLREAELDGRELESYKKLVTTGMAVEMKDPDTMFEFVRYRYADNRDISSEFAARMAEVTSQDVNRVIATLLSGENIKWVWK